MDSLSSTAIRKVSRELHSLDSDPPEGIRLVANEESIADIQAWIKGPDGTPYEGGCFGVRIQLPSDYPESPPKCIFTTKIFHPNVSLQGDVCVSTLKKDWKQDLGLRHILLVIKCLLIVPNAESALNEEAGRQLLDRFDDYAKHARLMTSIHARSNTHLIFPPTASILPGVGDTMTQDRIQEHGAATDTTIPIAVLGVKRKLIEDMDESVHGSDQQVRHQATARGRMQPTFPRYPVSIGPTNPTTSPISWPLPLPTAHGASASANIQIYGKGPCLQEHQNLAKPQQSQLSDFKGPLSKMAGSTSVTSQATLLQCTSVQPPSLGLPVSGPDLLMDGISMATSSSYSGGIGLGSGSGGNGRSGGGFSSGNSCRDHVGILTPVDRKRALRRL